MLSCTMAVTSSNVQAELEALLDKAVQIGHCSFAVSGPVFHADNPGIHVNGLGKIGLPLSDRDALALIEVKKRLPGEVESEGGGEKSEKHETTLEPLGRTELTHEAKLANRTDLMEATTNTTAHVS